MATSADMSQARMKLALEGQSRVDDWAQSKFVLDEEKRVESRARAAERRIGLNIQRKQDFGARVRDRLAVKRAEKLALEAPAKSLAEDGANPTADVVD